MPDLACIGLFANSELVRAMAYKMVWSADASLGVVAVILAPNATFADPVTTVAGGSVAANPAFRRQAGRCSVIGDTTPGRSGRARPAISTNLRMLNPA